LAGGRVEFIKHFGEDVHVEDFGYGRMTLRRIVRKFLVRRMSVIKTRVHRRSLVLNLRVLRVAISLEQLTPKVSKTQTSMCLYNRRQIF
jgi:hypothetical protein